MHSLRGYPQPVLRRACWTAVLVFQVCRLTGFGQVDPYHRNLLQLGYDQPIEWQGPQAVYAYWTNVGHQVSFATTVGGSTDADRLNAWRLGGVLPLITEFPLILPGYMYQELTAQRFALFRTAYLISLDPEHRFQLRFEAATASIKSLPGFELPDRWQTGIGGGLIYTPKRRYLRLVARYGYGINALRDDGERGGHSVGLLFQYDFERHKERK